MFFTCAGGIFIPSSTNHKRYMKKMDFYFGGMMFLCLMGFFFLMKALGLATNLNLRMINFIIQFTLVFYAMRMYRRSVRPEAFSFGNTFLAGVRASVPAVLGFALFQLLYLKFLNPGFMLYIEQTAPFGEYLSPGAVALLLVFEGMTGALFSAYVGMRILAMQKHEKFSGL